MKKRIKGIIVNHNSSKFTECALRSLFIQNKLNDTLAIEIWDNNSFDDMSSLVSYAKEKDIPIIKTRWNTDTPGNTHGEILTEFTLSNPNVPYLLFLDSDIIFCEKDTLLTMMEELLSSEDIYAVTGRMTRDGKNEISKDQYSEGRKLYQDFIVGVEPPNWKQITEPYHLTLITQDRCHPFCCLIRNSSTFQTVVNAFGLSAACTCECEIGRIYDTCGLSTAIMKTHGFRYITSSKLIYHFCGATYSYSEDNRNLIQKKCQRYIDQLNTGSADIFLE